MSLSKTQIRYLRSLAHALKPVVLVGAKGLTAGVFAELEQALEHHELVKLRIAADDRDSREQVAVEIARQTKSESVQRIGHTLTLYRRNADAPRIALPR